MRWSLLCLVKVSTALWSVDTPWDGMALDVQELDGLRSFVFPFHSFEFPSFLVTTYLVVSTAASSIMNVLRKSYVYMI